MKSEKCLRHKGGFGGLVQLRRGSCVSTTCDPEFRIALNGCHSPIHAREPIYWLNNLHAHRSNAQAAHDNSEMSPSTTAPAHLRTLK